MTTVVTGGAAAATLTVTPLSNPRVTTVFQDGTGQLGLTKWGTATFEMLTPSPNTYTGATTVGSGLFQLAFNANVSTNLVNPSSPLVLAGGTLEITTDGFFGSMTGTAVSQTFNTATAAAGQSTVRATPPSGGTATLTLTAISRNPGGTVNFDVSQGAVRRPSANVGGVLAGGDDRRGVQPELGHGECRQSGNGHHHPVLHRQ